MLNSLLKKESRNAARLLIFYALSGIVPIQDSNARAFQFSIGEKEDFSFLRPLYGCGTDARQVAEHVCASETTDGKTIGDFSLTVIYEEDGHKCGYSIVRVVCAPPHR